MGWNNLQIFRIAVFVFPTRRFLKANQTLVRGICLMIGLAKIGLAPVFRRPGHSLDSDGRRDGRSPDDEQQGGKRDLPPCLMLLRS